MAKHELNNEVAARRLKRVGTKQTATITRATFFLGIVVLSLAAATQWFAHNFNYDPALGGNLARLYAPWKILLWHQQWATQYGDVFRQSWVIGITVMALGLLGLLVHRVVDSNSSKSNPFLHGSAEWAREEDIKKSGLLRTRKRLLGIIPTSRYIGGQGVVVGAYMNERGETHWLRHNGPEHVLVYAPTRSGKGVGLVIPTLLSWPHSVVATDLKGELWSLTSGWRKEHARNRVLRFEPAAAEGSAYWNALDEIRLGTEYEVGDVQNLATLIVDPDGKGLQNHWQKTSQALLVGVILHVLYAAKIDSSVEATLPGVDAILADPERDVSQLWEEMRTMKHLGDSVHPVVAAAARDMLDRPEEEAGSVLSTLKSYLSLYRDPIVQRNVRSSTFRIKQLMNHDDPVSLYIVTQPNDKNRLRPLVRVLINMIVRLTADKMDFEAGRPVQAYKHRLLMMLEEFPSLGKLEIIQESLAFLGGYGVKCYLVCQDITQLRSRETGYGDQEQITSNCHIQSAYPPNRYETAQYLSNQTGITTVQHKKVSTSGRRVGIMHGQVSSAIEGVQRPLMTPDEAMRMPSPVKDPATGEITDPGDMVIFVAGLPAIYGRQGLYFRDPVFQARAAINAPRASDQLIASSDIRADECVVV